MLARTLCALALVLGGTSCRCETSPEEPHEGDPAAPAPPTPAPVASPAPGKSTPPRNADSAPTPADTVPSLRRGKVLVVPKPTQRTLAAHCETKRVVPRFSGFADPGADERLNQDIQAEFDALEKALFADAPCKGTSEELPHGFEARYELGATRGDYVTLELSGSAYTGGAHPNGLAWCYVVSFRDARLLTLDSLLTPLGRTKLSELTTIRVAEEHGVTRLSEAGFFVDKLQVQNPHGLCLAERGIDVQFQPYEVAPYALGLPRVEFEMSEVRHFFDRKPAPGLFDVEGSGPPSPTGSDFVK